MWVLKTPDDLIRERQDSARLYETAKDGVGEHKTPHCSISRARRKSPSPNPTAPRPLTWNGLKVTTHHIAITSNQLFIERLDCAPSWSCRLGFQSIAWDMRVWQGVWEGGWSCSESKWEEFFFFFFAESKPSSFLPYWPLPVWPTTELRATGWRTESENNHVNFHSTAMSFLLSHCLTVEKWTPAHCLKATCVSAAFSQRHIFLFITMIVPYKHKSHKTQRGKKLCLWPSYCSQEVVLTPLKFLAPDSCVPLSWWECGNSTTRRVLSANTDLFLGNAAASLQIWPTLQNEQNLTRPANQAAHKALRAHRHTYTQSKKEKNVARWAEMNWKGEAIL